MRAVSQDQTCIDYFQSFSYVQRGLTNRFGIRVIEGHCEAVVQIGNGKPCTFGKQYPLPVNLETLPSHLQVMIAAYLLQDQDSELTDVLVGRKSFREALDSPPERRCRKR